MKEVLTIVIPCKNEKDTIYECIGFISKQSGIAGTKVIIADSSDDEDSWWWISKAVSNFKHLINIEVIKGGFPAKARLEGSRLVSTPYVLFLDADIMLFDKFLLASISQYRTDLVTVPFQTDKKWNWIFRLFDFQQKLSILVKSPFAVGGFQYWNTESYWKCGGYDETHLFAEDYAISSKVKNMMVHKTKAVWTSPRRFENKGFLYMFWLSIKCYIHRKDSSFFQKHHNYWK